MTRTLVDSDGRPWEGRRFGILGADCGRVSVHPRLRGEWRCGVKWLTRRQVLEIEAGPWLVCIERLWVPGRQPFRPVVTMPKMTDEQKARVEDEWAKIFDLRWRGR